MRPYTTIRQVARRRPLLHISQFHTLVPFHVAPRKRLSIGLPKVFVKPKSYLWNWRKSGHPRTWSSIRDDVVTISRLSRYLNDKIGRAPDDEELEIAFHGIVSAHWGKDVTLVDDYAAGLCKVYDYVDALPVDDLKKALNVVFRADTETKLLLARKMFEGLENSNGYKIGDEEIMEFTHILTRTGNTAEALELCAKYSGKFKSTDNERRVWGKVLAGFSIEGNEAALLQTWGKLEEAGIDIHPKLYTPLVTFYCERNELGKARIWYDRVVASEHEPVSSAYVEILRSCLRTRNYEWGNEVVKALLEGKDPNLGREAWHAVLRWNIAIGRTPEEISQMLDMMDERAKAVDTLPVPNIDTINNLLRFGMGFLGPEFNFSGILAIADKRGFDGDRTTLELRLVHKVQTNDLRSALEVYEDLRTTLIPRDYQATETKSFLRALCSQEPLNRPLIRSVYSDLLEWGVRLDGETLCVMLKYFLEECTFKDVIHLLTRETHSTSEKARIIHEMGEYIGRDTTSIEAAWDTYQILYQLFPETSIHQRNELMNLFFQLGRSDMGVLIFQHMRQSRKRKPDRRSYAIALAGVAMSRDLEALKVIHNALKMNYQFDPDTRLLNGLMRAYTNCGLPSRALEFWNHIRKSRQGPDDASISIALDSCGRLDDGMSTARILWGQLRSTGVRPSANNYCAYIEALGRNGMWNEGFRLAKEMQSLDNLEPTFRLYGSPPPLPFPSQP